MAPGGCGAITIAAGVLGLVGAFSPPALTVSPEAETLFQEGRRSMAAGDTAEACARFASSFALEASSGTLLNLALCHETLGKTATAWAEYREAARLARAQGRDDRAAVADQKVAAIEPRLARLTAVPAKTVPGLTVDSEQGSLIRDGLGVAVPIDPGVHTLTAKAPGHRPWTTTLEVKESEQRTLLIPGLENEEVPKATALPVMAHRVEARPALLAEGSALAPVAATPHRLSSFELYSAMGGGLLLIAGTVAWSFAYSEFKSLRSICVAAPGCTEGYYNDRSSTIRTLEGVAIGSWIAGGALVVVSGLHFGFRKMRSPVTVAIDVLNSRLSIQGALW